MKAFALLLGLALATAALPAQTLQEIADSQANRPTYTPPPVLTLTRWRGLTETDRAAVVAALRKRAQEFREEAPKAICCHCKEMLNTKAASYDAAAEFVANYEAPVATVTMAPQG